MIIGITGGTGCGKTTALQAIERLGGIIIDCDKVYHNLLQTDTAMLCAIESRFPDTVKAGVVDRRALASVVFSDARALLDLNGITHGAVKAKVLALLESKPALAAIDAIGLFEGGLHKLCDVTVAVTAPEDVRIQRLMLRDKITAQQAQMRINAQAPQASFAEKCDYVLENNGSQEDFQKKCFAFFQNLLIIKENA